METRDTISVDARAQRRLYVLQHLDAGRIMADEAARILGLSVRQARRLLAAFRSEGSRGWSTATPGRRPGTGRRTTCGTAWSSSPGPRTRGSTGPTWPSCSRSARVSRSPSGPCAGSSTRLASRRSAGAPAAAPEPARPDGPGGAPAPGRRSRHDWLEAGARSSPWWRDRRRHEPGDRGDLPTAETRRATSRCSPRRPAGTGSRPPCTRPPRDLRRRGEPATDARGAAGRQAEPDPGRPRPRRAGVRWIGARSPQAKGRVERLWDAPDRLTTELRLAGRRRWRRRTRSSPVPAPHNRRFTVPAHPVPAWRPMPEASCPRRRSASTTRAGRQRRHGQLARRAARAAAAAPRTVVGRPVGDPPGAPHTERRFILCPAPRRVDGVPGSIWVFPARAASGTLSDVLHLHRGPAVIVRLLLAALLAAGASWSGAARQPPPGSRGRAQLPALDERLPQPRRDGRRDPADGDRLPVDSSSCPRSARATRAATSGSPR